MNGNFFKEKWTLDNAVQFLYTESSVFILKEDKASGGLQRCADVLCHVKHDVHLAGRMPAAFLNHRICKEKKWEYKWWESIIRRQGLTPV